MIQAGDIGFSGKYKPSLYSSIVMWATKSRWSHTFCIFGECVGELCVLEAHLDMAVVSFQHEYIDKEVDHYEIYRPIKATHEDIELAGHECFDAFAAEDYGFLQPLWFLLQALLYRVGIHIKRNWFRSGLVCSGLTYEYMKRLGPDYATLLLEFDADNVTPEDLYQKVKNRPDLFEFVTERR